MQFALNEDQILLKNSIERFVETRYGAAQRTRYRAEPLGFSQDNWRELAELGLFGLAFPVEQGGMGGSARDLSAVMEALGRGLVIEPMLEQILLAARAFAQLAGQADRSAWLPKILEGSVHVALAHVEHAARFNLKYVQTRARSANGRWTLSGSKSLVASAKGADLYVVSARDKNEADDESGLAFYLVAAQAGGMERHDYVLTDGSSASAIVFKDTAAVRLPGGFECFQRCVDVARLAAAAEMIGIMSRIFESTLDYLRTRKQFGAALASFQAIQHRLAMQYVHLEQARSQVCRAAMYLDHAREAHTAVVGMKSYVGSMAVQLAETCVHFHGGIGMSDELELGHGFKRLLVLASLFGDPDAELKHYAELSAQRPGH